MVAVTRDNHITNFLFLCTSLFPGCWDNEALNVQGFTLQTQVYHNTQVTAFLGNCLFVSESPWGSLMATSSCFLTYFSFTKLKWALLKWLKDILVWGTLKTLTDYQILGQWDGSAVKVIAPRWPTWAPLEHTWWKKRRPHRLSTHIKCKIK